MHVIAKLAAVGGSRGVRTPPKNAPPVPSNPPPLHLHFYCHRSTAVLLPHHCNHYAIIPFPAQSVRDITNDLSSPLLSSPLLSSLLHSDRPAVFCELEKLSDKQSGLQTGVTGLHFFPPPADSLPSSGTKTLRLNPQKKKTLTCGWRSIIRPRSYRATAGQIPDMRASHPGIRR